LFLTLQILCTSEYYSYLKRHETYKNQNERLKQFKGLINDEDNLEKLVHNNGDVANIAREHNEENFIKKFNEELVSNGFNNSV